MNQGLVLQRGQVYCQVCCKAQKTERLGEHLATAKHRNQLPDFLAKQNARQASLVEMVDRRAANGLQGQTLDRATHQYRRDVYAAILASPGISLRAFQGMKWMMDLHTGKDLGEVRDYSRNYLNEFKEDVVKHLKSIFAGSFEQIATIIDGTPSFANAEAIIVRSVRKKDWQLLELLVRVELFQGSLKSDAIANHVIQALRVRCEIDPDNWMANMMDRASTNLCAMNRIRERTAYDPSDKPCNSHTLCKPGDRMEDGCLFAKEWRKIWINVVKNSK